MNKTFNTYYAMVRFRIKALQSRKMVNTIRRKSNCKVCSSMQDACHMNFVIDLAHRGVSVAQSAESEDLRFNSSRVLRIFFRVRRFVSETSKTGLHSHSSTNVQIWSSESQTRSNESHLKISIPVA